MDIFVYLFRIRATISDPPVVPPALKITPNPIPSRTPETKETIIKSPCKSNCKGIRSNTANQTDREKVPRRLE